MLPLEGLKVVDLTRMLVGPTCTMLLADLGAEVIKIEPPAGDDTRYLQTRDEPNDCPFFLSINRNKRGVVLDLASVDGLEAFNRLVADADILVHNYRNGIVDKLGIDAATIRARHPQLIYCAISAFGEEGPYSARPGTDVLFQAMTGLMAITGEPDGAPIRAAAPLVDVTTGISALSGILTALIQRGQTGQGDLVNVSLFDQSAFMQSPLLSWSAAENANPPRLGNRSPMALILQIETADGTIMASIPNNKFWRLLCTMIGDPALADDPRFRDISSRLDNQDDIADLLRPHFSEGTTAEWVDRLVDAGVPCGAVTDYLQVLEDPQLASNGMFLRVGRVAGGHAGEELPVLAPPFRLSSVPYAVRLQPPNLGRDTADVLTELGFTPEEQSAFGTGRKGAVRA